MMFCEMGHCGLPKAVFFALRGTFVWFKQLFVFQRPVTFSIALFTSVFVVNS